MLLPGVSPGPPPSLVSFLNPSQASVDDLFSCPLDHATSSLDISEQIPIVYSLHQYHRLKTCLLPQKETSESGQLHRTSSKDKRVIISLWSSAKWSWPRCLHLHLKGSCLLYPTKQNCNHAKKCLTPEKGKFLNRKISGTWQMNLSSVLMLVPLTVVTFLLW